MIEGCTSRRNIVMNVLNRLSHTKKSLSNIIADCNVSTTIYLCYSLPDEV